MKPEATMRTVGHLRGLYTEEEERKAKQMYLSQILCPERHCVLAIGGDTSAAETEAHAWRAVGLMIETNTINPWCGLCRAPREKWHAETATLPGTLAENEPALREEERRQMETAALNGDSRRN